MKWLRNSSKITVQHITLVALLVTLQIVLANITQIPLLGKQYNVGFLPIAYAGWLMGAPAAIVIGGLGDFIGAHLFPQGAYFPGFTFTNLLVGFVYGKMLYKKNIKWSNIAITTLITSSLYLFLNSLWLMMLYTSKGYWEWVAIRSFSYIFEYPAYTVISYFVLLRFSKMPSSNLKLARNPDFSGGSNEQQK